jgi:hypothetical protein
VKHPTVVSYLTVKAVLGKYTTRILLDAGAIIPAGNDSRGHPVFDARSLHHSLSRLARAAALIPPRIYQSGSGRGQKKSEPNSEFVVDVERLLAQLTEE